MSSTEDGLEEGNGFNHHLHHHHDHVPQQSRRDKLRFINLLQTHYYPPTNSTSYQVQQAAAPITNHHHHHHQLLPVATLYDPSSHDDDDDDDDDLLRCSATGNPLLLLASKGGRGGGRGGGTRPLKDDDDDYDYDYKFHFQQQQPQQQQALPLVRLSSSSSTAAVVKEQASLGGVNFMAGFGGGGGGGLMMNSTVNQMNNPTTFSSSLQGINNNNNTHHFDNHNHNHNLVQAAVASAAAAGGGGGGGGGGLSLSLSSSSHPSGSNSNYNNTNHALELHNLMSPPPPQQPRFHDRRSDNSTSISETYTITAGGGGGAAGVSAATALTSNTYLYNGGISTTSARVPVPNVEGAPFTGYTIIMKNSRFLKPTQQLLNESCNMNNNVGGGGGNGASSTNTGGISHHHVDEHNAMIGGGDGDSLIANLMDPNDTHQILEKLNETVTSRYGGTSTSTSTSDHNHHHHYQTKKTTRLISMLDEVYNRYKQYYQQMLEIVASFESVADLGNAAPYTSFAIKAMSKHFRCLKNAITDQLYFTSINSGEVSLKEDEYPRFGTTTDQYVRSSQIRPAQDAGNVLERQNAWRTQRGLPERAVALLKAWLFEHFLHPYPTDTDKQMLAKQTGLSRSQVSNWFINARVRLWKPMVEEIHTLETRQKASEPGDQNSTIQLNEPTLGVHEPPSKRSRNELPPLVLNKSTNDQMLNFSCNNVSSYQKHVSVGGITNNRVSLTLGLRQNNGSGGLSTAPPSFPMSIAQRFGIEADNEGYVIDSSGFEASNHPRPYRKDIGGQLLHDFIG